MKAPYAVVDTTPDEVRDETFLPAPGRTRYLLTLNDEQVELLAAGLCSEALAHRAFEMLSWKRDAWRAQRRRRLGVPP